MAERVGFEPTSGVDPTTRFRVVRLQPDSATSPKRQGKGSREKATETPALSGTPCHYPRSVVWPFPLTLDPFPCLLGAPGPIRTGDLELRRFLLYPTELRGPGMRQGKGLRVKGKPTTSASGVVRTRTCAAPWCRALDPFHFTLHAAFVVRPARFERATPGSGGQCSIR